MIVIDRDGVDEGPDQEGAVIRIVAVAFGHAGEEKFDPVAAGKLGGGILFLRDDSAQLLSLFGEGIQERAGRAVPDSVCDGIVYIVDLPGDFLQIGFVFRQRGFLLHLLLGFHDGIRDAIHLRTGEDPVIDEGDHLILQDFLPDGLFMAAGAGLL